MHAYGHDVPDSWLLKDDTEANKVTESGIEFHSVIVLAAKDFWARLQYRNNTCINKYAAYSVNTGVGPKG